MPLVCVLMPLNAQVEVACISLRAPPAMHRSLRKIYPVQKYSLDDVLGWDQMSGNRCESLPDDAVV